MMLTYQINVSYFLPNLYIDDDDIENLPKLLNKVYLNNCIVCLDDLKDSIACKMDLCLFYERHNIKSIKEQLLSRVNSHNNPYEDSMICYELRLNIIKCNPYFCKYDDLDGTKSFKKINKREIVKEFALCYSNKNRIEKFDEVKFRINSNTDILVEKVSVKMSIRQIVSFLSMIRNTSRILTEKYTDKIKNDDSLMLERRNPNNSLTKKSLAELSEFTDNIIMVKEANKIKETFDIFSTRYNKVPKRIPKTFEFEDEEEEKHAIDSKAKNIQLLTSSFPARNDEDDLEELKQVTTEEATGRDSFSFFFHGLSIYFINDYKDNFYPVISLDFNDTSYCKNNRTDGSFTSQSKLLANFKYYNVNNGYWEPFVEGLNISFEYDKQSESRVFQVKGKELINLNLSPDFVAVINYCWKSWEQAQKHMNSKSSKEEAKDYFSNEDIFSEEAKIRYDSEIKMKDRETIFNLNEEEDIIDIATPYRV